MASIPPSLRALFDEANRRWPSRDRASDGSIGDAAHAARASDHNPAERGRVHADDLDKDLRAPFDAFFLGIRLALRGDPRVHYLVRYDGSVGEDVIFNFESQYVHAGWRRTGKSDHGSHLHISIWHTEAAENDTSPWFDFLDGATDVPRTTPLPGGQLMARTIGQKPDRLLRADTSHLFLFRIRTPVARYKNAIYVSDLASFRRHITDDELDVYSVTGQVALDEFGKPIVLRRTVDEARDLPLVGRRYKTTLR